MKIKVPKMPAELISEEEALKMTNFENLDEVRENLEKWQEVNEKRGFLILGYNEDGISYFGTGGARGTLAGIMASLIRVRELQTADEAFYYCCHKMD